MVNLTQIEQGVLTFVENEIVSKATPLNKFITTTAIALATPKAEKMILEYADMPIMKTLEVVDENGMFDIDKIYTSSKTAIQKSGSFAIAGIIFDEKDLDKLYQYIKKAN